MLIRIGAHPDHGFDEPLDLLSDCHRRIEHFLAVLTAFARQSDRPLEPAERSQLEGALVYFATAAPRHTADEEHSLFPRLRALRDPAARAALDTVARLEHEHAIADVAHKAVNAIVRRWLVAGGLTESDRAELRDQLASLKAIYDEHIGIEDRELFPAARRLLSSEEISDIGREMERRRRADAPQPSRPVQPAG